MADPKELANAISEARARLLAFVERCPDEQWGSEPLGDEDRRSVALIVDHVADSYEYLGAWMIGMLAGEPADVNSDVVDELNAKHASSATALDRTDVIEHLSRSGDEMIALVSGLSSEQLASNDGRVERFAEIACRHADAHRSELEESMAL